MGLLDKFTTDIGIDLGTANTLVYVKGKGIVINEPSVVAMNTRTKQIVAIGNDARRMVGRTPAHIVAVRPLVDGVISDFEVTEHMLRYFIDKVFNKIHPWLRRPRVVVGVPSGVTEVEKRAVHDAVLNAGARRAYLVEEPMAAAIGARLPVQDADGSMIVDIGGGTTEIAILSLGGIVLVRSLRIAGDKMNEQVISYIKEKYNLLIGERTAEDLKIKIGTAVPLEEPLTAAVRGRDVITGLPREIHVSSEDVRFAMEPAVRGIVNAVMNVVEQTPPELVGDIMQRGMVLAGGGSLLRGIDDLLQAHTKVPVSVTEDPLTAVARGAGGVVEDLEQLAEVLVSGLDEAYLAR